MGLALLLKKGGRAEGLRAESIEQENLLCVHLDRWKS